MERCNWRMSDSVTALASLSGYRVILVSSDGLLYSRETNESDGFKLPISDIKVFVANPNKPKPIADILIRNREKLVEFLSKFHSDRTEDEQFNDEKAYLIKQIQEMK
ncbi:unnamed protein product [Soboliphyme baturini]|uniref:IDEAL domain-containing protein n=1 Tax=Soboliphyme baturini TaxID=241478 RepID=A0A183IWV5_9BILA|nr:unnamed protein product [Soboliphyme baturini]